MRLATRTLALLLAFAATGPGLVRGAPGPAGAGGRAQAFPAPAPALQVRLYDPYRLLSRPVRNRLQSEAAEAFGRSGASVEFVTRGGRRVIPATLYPELPTDWRVEPQALGVAVGVPGERRSVFLSVGAAKRALGWRGAPREANAVGGRRAARLGTALGRVLAHELLHTIAPDCPHTRTGLMAANLSRRALVAPGVGFDRTAERYLHRGLAAFGAGSPGTG